MRSSLRRSKPEVSQLFSHFRDASLGQGPEFPYSRMVLWIPGIRGVFTSRPGMDVRVSTTKLHCGEDRDGPAGSFAGGPGSRIFCVKCPKAGFPSGVVVAGSRMDDRKKSPITRILGRSWALERFLIVTGTAMLRKPVGAVGTSDLLGIVVQ